MTAYLITKDRDGKRVTIHQKNWAHIVTRHPEMAGIEEAVVRTIADPDLVSEAANDPIDPSGERLVCCRHEPTIGRSRPYLWVYIEYSHQGHWVPTAYLNALPPKGPYRFVRLLTR
jgi:hypothetical protein